jgi:two-component system nitrate/nitrite sensor histidine kinase NarX
MGLSDIELTSEDHFVASRGTRYSEEQIIRILEEVEAGTTIAKVCRQRGVSEQTVYRWRNKYGGLSTSELHRLREPEAENKERLYQRIFKAVGDGMILHDLETSLVVEANPAACAMHGYAHEDFIGLHPSAFMHRDSHAQFTEWVQAVQGGNEYEATVVHIGRDGTPVTVEVRGTGCIYQDRPCLLSVVRDVSERVQVEQLLRQQMGARMREQAILREISQTLASELELKPGLILDQLRVLLEYTHAALFSLEAWNLVALAVRGSPRLEQAIPFRIRLNGAETLTSLLNGRRPQRIADVWTHDPAAQFLRSLLDDQAAALLEGVQAWMWIPLAVKGRMIGGVAVTHTEPDYFTAHHADLALTMANLAAITMVNAQLHEQQQTLAVLEERQRLAQNLHDAVNQSLFSASLIAEVLPRLWEQRPDEVHESLEDLRRLTRGALAEMRGLMVELRPLVLNDTELDELLRLLGDALTGRMNIPVTINVSGQAALPADVQIMFYRLCQEAMINIAKHSGAGQVTIDLLYESEAVRLSIRDNGRGFDPERIGTGHYGLIMMQERANAVGAALSIMSRPGQGTEITVHWRQTPEEKVM